MFSGGVRSSELVVLYGVVEVNDASKGITGGTWWGTSSATGIGAVGIDSEFDEGVGGTEGYPAMWLGSGSGIRQILCISWELVVE